ncbi:MAG: TetR/AcrR family transcriptional regulator [Candidatus Sericytochromatia bacterium]
MYNTHMTQMQAPTLSTRDKILQATLELLSEGGQEALTASSLIQRAGISKGSLYHHFRSIDDIPLETLDYALRNLMPDLQPADYPDISAFLTAFGPAHLRICAQEKHFSMFYFFYQKALQDQRYREAIHTMVERYNSYLSRCLQHYCVQSVPDSVLLQLVVPLLATLDAIGSFEAMFKAGKAYYPGWELMVDVVCERLAPYQTAP